MEALRDVDPVFANERCTEIAVTYGFRGSPHLDKQNCGPFYGLSMGNFSHGGICVESSARVVVVVDTKHKLAKIDGRCVHWVAPYDNDDDEPKTENETKTNDDGHTAAAKQPVERYSLIYYETGNDFVTPGPAVFSIPTTTKTTTDTEGSLKLLKI
eukprot:scaffold52644_cov56-Attheya_sp.AAC.3